MLAVLGKPRLSTTSFYFSAIIFQLCANEVGEMILRCRTRERRSDLEDVDLEEEENSKGKRRDTFALTAVRRKTKVSFPKVQGFL